MCIWHEGFAVGGGYVVGVRNFYVEYEKGSMQI